MDRFDLLQFEDAEEMFVRRAKEADNRKKKLDEIEKSGYCEGVSHQCNNKESIKWISSRTYYEWDVDEQPGEDPNRPRFLCPSCAKEWNDYWDEMWNEYYAGRL